MPSLRASQGWVERLALLYSFYLLILVVKPRILRKANLIVILATNPMERNKEGSFSFRWGEESPREMFQGKPTQLGRV